MFLEPDDLVPVCLFWTVLLSALLHTVVRLKRTWDQKLSSGLTSGHLDVAITDLMLLTHMTIHLFQFSFADTEQYSLRPPPTLINWWPSWWITFDAVRAPSRSLRSVWDEQEASVPMKRVALVSRSLDPFLCQQRIWCRFLSDFVVDNISP